MKQIQLYVPAPKNNISLPIIINFFFPVSDPIVQVFWRRIEDEFQFVPDTKHVSLSLKIRENNNSKSEQSKSYRKTKSKQCSLQFILSSSIQELKQNFSKYGRKSA